MKLTLSLAAAVLLGHVSAGFSSGAGSYLYKNEWFTLSYKYSADLTYGTTFSTSTNLNNPDAFEATYDLYIDGMGSYGFDVSVLGLFEGGFGMSFSGLHLMPYRQTVAFVNPTAVLIAGTPFDMGGHGSYEISFGALSTSYSISAPIFDKSIVDYLISLPAILLPKDVPHPKPEPGPITPQDPSTANTTFNETEPTKPDFNQTKPHNHTHEPTNQTANQTKN